MTNNYEMPAVLEIGRAQDVILGSQKGLFFVPDGPDQYPRETETADDE